MKRYIFSILWVVAGFFMVVSCKGFLDTEPTDKVVAETAMKTLYDANVAVNGLYKDIKYQDYYGGMIQLLGDQRGDNIQPRLMSTGWVQVYSLGYDAEATTYFSLWTRCYEAIMRCNTLIENLDKLEAASAADIAKKKDYLGQAYCTGTCLF